MENPFLKLANSEEIVESEDSTREEPMTLEDKEKRLADLREWKMQVETGMRDDPHSDDPEQLEKIDELIRKIEQQ